MPPNHDPPPPLTVALETPHTPEEWSFPFTHRSMLHEPECANSDTGDPIRDAAGLLCTQSRSGHGVSAGEETERGGNGVFGFPAFVLRALLRARQQSKEQLCVKRRQAGTSCKDEGDSKDIRLNWGLTVHNFVNKAAIYTLCGHESQFNGVKI